MEDEDVELYVVDLNDFIEALAELKKEVRANDEYSSEFKRGSDFVCEFLLDNYREVLNELVSQKTDKLH